MSMKKDEIIAFMSKHDIKIPNPILRKSVLFGKNSQKNIEKLYVIDSMAEKAGYFVLRLSHIIAY